MLNVWPVDIASRESQVRLDRFTRVARIADDESANYVHPVAMDVVDRLQRGVSDFLPVLAHDILRTGSQELQIVLKNVFDSQKDILESCFSHQRRQSLT